MDVPAWIELARRDRRTLQLQRDRVPPLHPALQPRDGLEVMLRGHRGWRAEQRRLKEMAERE